MASDDVYLRKDVYEADQRAARAEIKLGNEEVLRAIEQFRIEINGKIEEFRAEVNDRFAKVDSRFDKLEARIDVLTGRVDGLEKRMDAFDSRLDSIQTYVGLGIAFVTMVITLYAFFAPLIKSAAKLFKPEPKPESSPSITVEQVREIFRTEAEAIISSKLKAMR